MLWNEKFISFFESSVLITLIYIPIFPAYIHYMSFQKLNSFENGLINLQCRFCWSVSCNTKPFEISSHLARSSQYSNKKNTRKYKTLSQAIIHFIFPTDYIIQLTWKLMYNNVTEQNLKTCIRAIIIKSFVLTKNLKNIQT